LFAQGGGNRKVNGGKKNGDVKERGFAEKGNSKGGKKTFKEEGE